MTVECSILDSYITTSREAEDGLGMQKVVLVICSYQLRAMKTRKETYFGINLIVHSIDDCGKHYIWCSFVALVAKVQTLRDCTHRTRDRPSIVNVSDVGVIVGNGNIIEHCNGR